MRLLIFDFDGTLWDSLELIREVLNELGPRFGFKPLSAAKMDALRRSSARAIIRELGLRPRQVPALARSVRARVNERRAELRPFEGILGALEQLRERGYSLALLSSNHEGAIRSLLGPKWVEAFVHIEGDTGMWDKPAALERILERFELRAEQAMYIGDELRDIVAARKAGLDAVAVEWGANHAQLLVTAAPALMVGAPSELPGALERHSCYLRDYGGRLDAPAAWDECASALRELSGDLAVSARLLPVGLRRTLTLTYLLAHSIDSLATHDARPVERLAVLAGALEEGTWPVSELSELERGYPPRERQVFALMPKLLRLLEALPSAQCGALRAALLARSHVAQRELRRRHEYFRFTEAAEYARYIHQSSGLIAEALTRALADNLDLDARCIAELERHAPALTRTLVAVEELREFFANEQSTRIPHAYFGAAIAGLDPGEHTALLRALRTFAGVIEDDLEGACAYLAALPRSHYRERLFLFKPLLLARLSLDRVWAEPPPFPGDRWLAPSRLSFAARAARSLGPALRSRRGLERALLRDRSRA